MKWITIPDKDNVRNYLPMDGSAFLALWKGQFCLASFDDEYDKFWIQMLPGTYEGDWSIDHEREGKFTHYCKLEYPEDY